MSSQPNDFDAVLPPAARQRIEEKVEAYVETWKRYRTATASDRQRPDPSVFLEDSTSSERLVLLRRLCEVDILCRREMGEQPRAEDYDRYPEVAAALLHLFEESELNGGAAQSPIRDIEEAVEGITPKWKNPELSVSHSSSEEVIAPVPSDELIPGYRILKELNRGGQGVVYQAIQKSARRKVALKLMLQGPLAAPDSKRRFEREIARLVACGIRILCRFSIVAWHKVSSSMRWSIYGVNDSIFM